MNLSLGSDHAGFEQKKSLISYLRQKGYNVIDQGPFDSNRVDYPDYAYKVAKDIVRGRAEYGILICGTGIGMAIAANKVSGIRAANITTLEFAKLCREHNNANVLTLSGRFIDDETNKNIVDIFLQTPFLGGRHADRVAKIMAMDEKE